MIISTRYEKGFNRIQQCIPNKNPRENRDRWTFLHTLTQIDLIPIASALLRGDTTGIPTEVRNEEKIPTVSTATRQCLTTGKAV